MRKYKEVFFLGGGVAGTISDYQRLPLHAPHATPESRGLRELSSQQFQVEMEGDWRLHAGMEGDQRLQTEMEGARRLLS